MKITKELHDELKKLRRAMIKDGIEFLNPTPVAIPIGMERPPSLKEQIQRVLRTELSMQAAAQGEETFEEADDFDVPEDDPDPVSPYEMNEMQYEEPSFSPTDPLSEPSDTAPDPIETAQPQQPEANPAQGNNSSANES